MYIHVYIIYILYTDTRVCSIIGIDPPLLQVFPNSGWFSFALCVATLVDSLHPYPQLMTNIAIEHGQIVSFPIYSMVIFQFVL